jgi:gliding motility-associated-like protein
MRKILLLVVVLWSLGLSAQQGFVRNDGQWEDPSMFRLQIGPNSLFVTEDSLVVSVLNPNDFDANHMGDHHHYQEHLHFHVFSIKFKDASKLSWFGEDKYSAYLNYFVGNKERWRSRVESFARLRAKNVYPGIDLVVYESAGGFKFDWEVYPGANPSQIQLEYNGLLGIQIDDRELHLKTSFGDLVEAMPYAYQSSREVRANYREKEGLIGYKMGRYKDSETLIIDPVYIFSTYSGSTADNFGYTATFDDNGNAFGGGTSFGTGYPTSLGAVDTVFNGGAFDVAISKFSSDGTQLIWSTYLGGSNLDHPYSMDCDEFGNLYVLGSTGSNDFGVTSNAYDTAFASGPSVLAEYYTFSQGTDLFISRISPDGTQLLGSTYLGGAGNDGLNLNLAFNYGDTFRGDIEVGRNGGKVYIVSSTLSSSFPTVSTTTTHQGGQDGVISVLSRDMTQLLASSYAGTSGDDALYSIALVDKDGTSLTTSLPYNDFFAAGSVGASNDSTFEMGWVNPFNTSVPTSSDQNALLLSGYITPSGIGTGASMVMNALDVQTDTGYNQHFLVEVNSIDDTATIVTLMGQHKGGLVGDSSLWGQPGSAQYFQEFKRDSVGGFDLRKTSVWGDGSFMTVDVSPTALMVDDCGNTYFSGWGGAPNSEGNTFGLTTSLNAIQDSTDGRDLYFLVLDPAWKTPRLATYFGGTGREHVDGGTSRFDRSGRIFQAVCAGCGGNSDYPAFPSNVYSLVNSSFNCNLAVTVIDMDIQNARLELTPDPPVFCIPNSFNILDSSSNVQAYTIDWDDGNVSLDTGFITSHIYDTPGTYNVQVIGQDTVCDTWDTTTFTLQVNPAYDSVWIDYSYDYCDPSRQVVATARLVSDSSIVTDYELEWNFAGVNFSSAQVQFNMPVPGANPVSLNVLDTNCNITQLFEDTLVFRIPPFMQINTSLEECETRESVDFNAILNATYQGFEWLVDGQVAGNSNPLQISQSGIYDISIVGYDSICGTSDTLTESFDVYFAGEAFTVPNFVTPNNDGINDAFLVNTSENWDDFHLIVHNRWGVKVFETTVISFEWGADYDEKILAPGVYFYQLKATNRCGDITEDGVLHIIY